MDAQSQAVLFDVVRHCGRSMLQYVSESVPWTTGDSEATWERVLQLVQEEREISEKATRMLRNRRITPPYLGAFPMQFMTINYMSVAHLLRLLAEAQKKWIAELEPRIAEVSDADAKGLAKEALATAKSHLQAIEELQTQPQQT